MIIVSCWSFLLACLDLYSLKTKVDIQTPRLVKALVVGDWVRLILNTSAGSCILFIKSFTFEFPPSMILKFIKVIRTVDFFNSTVLNKF